MRKTILMTGGTGFLGSHVLNELICDDQYNVVCLKRSTSSISRVDLPSENKGIVFYDTDKVKIDEVFKCNSIDVIVHFATNYGRTNDSLHDILGANLMFPLEIIEKGIEYGVGAFINTDSFFNKKNFSYGHLLNYSLSKKALLTWIEKLSNKINIVNMIIEHVYGEKDDTSKFAGYVFKKVAIDKDEKIDLTYGHQRRDFVYVKDVVEAYKKVICYALSESFGYETFNVGAGEAIELRSFVEKIKKFSGSKTVLNYGSIAYRPDEIMESFAQNQGLRNLGWSPSYNIDDGIKNVLSYYGVCV